MLKEFSKKETNRYELVITVGAEEFKAAVDTAYRQNAKKINIPGFRKGKAPKSIIEKYYGESVFYEDALNILYPSAVEAAIEESKLDYVDDKIDFDLVSIDKETGVEFKIVITVKPEVAIKGYKGLKVEKVKAAVTADEINKEVAAVAERNARMITVEDRAAKMDDTVVIDFEGFVDGVAFEGGKGDSYSLGLGSGSFIPGFEDQIVGHNAGDEFDVNVTFPAEYQAKELAGKPAVFKVKLNEIKVKELPALDDEFAKEISEFESLADYKADIKAKLTETKKANAEKEKQAKAVAKAVENATMDIPQAMIKTQADRMAEDFAQRLQQQGLSFEMYMQYTGSTVAKFMESLMPEAEARIKNSLVLEAIAKAENIKVSDKDFEAELEKMAAMYQMEVDKLKEFMGDAEAEQIKADMAIQKAAELLAKKAVEK